MVHRADPAYESLEKTRRRNSKVKTEVVDSIDDQFCSLSKRPKFDYSNQEEEITQYNPLDEPSPLGLKLKKSPSFLDLIQMKLSQERSASLGKTLAKKEKGGPEKIKASNFPATLLTIGSWEYKSRYEGDLVAKCYFAKHKLVWEVLDGGLKNKIEIQWSDIMAIKATYPDDGIGTLDVVLSRQPLFFREINPQPRKHTLWQATSDFTSGQATINRRHFLQFPQGILGKHFEKLMQCDPRLSFLSQQPDIVLDTPYFQSMVSSFGDRDRSFNLMTPTFSGFKDTISVSGLSSDFENTDTIDTSPSSRRNPSSVIDMFLLEGELRRKVYDSHGLSLLNQIKLPGLRPSMSLGDLVNQIGECISEQMRSDNPNLSINESQKKNILEEITQYLLSDSQATPVSDERYIMSRVDSLCCLLQKEPPNGVHNLHDKCDNPLSAQNCDDDRTMFDLNVGSYSNQATEKLPALNGETGVVNSYKEAPSMSRKDSVDELLMNLPRIASLPQFLINVYEESVHGGR